MRRQAEIKINELQGIVEEAEMDRERLRIDVQEWKSLAEQYQARVIKYGQAMRKSMAYLEEVRPELDR